LEGSETVWPRGKLSIKPGRKKKKKKAGRKMPGGWGHRKGYPRKKGKGTHHCGEGKREELMFPAKVEEKRGLFWGKFEKKFSVRPRIRRNSKGGLQGKWDSASQWRKTKKRVTKVRQ